MGPCLRRAADSKRGPIVGSCPHRTADSKRGLVVDPCLLGLLVQSVGPLWAVSAPGRRYKRWARCGSISRLRADDTKVGSLWVHICAEPPIQRVGSLWAVSAPGHRYKTWACCGPVSAPGCRCKCGLVMGPCLRRATGTKRGFVVGPYPRWAAGPKRGFIVGPYLHRAAVSSVGSLWAHVCARPPMQNVGSLWVHYPGIGLMIQGVGSLWVHVSPKYNIKSLGRLDLVLRRSWPGRRHPFRPGSVVPVLGDRTPKGTPPGSRMGLHRSVPGPPQ